MNQSSLSSAYREGGTNSGVGGALLRNAGAIGKWLFYSETTLIIGYVRTSVNIAQKQPGLLFKIEVYYTNGQAAYNLLGPLVCQSCYKI